MLTDGGSLQVFNLKYIVCLLSTDTFTLNNIISLFFVNEGSHLNNGFYQAKVFKDPDIRFQT